MSILDLFHKIKYPNKTCPYCKTIIKAQIWSNRIPGEIEYFCTSNSHDYRLIYSNEKLLFVHMTLPYRDKKYLLSIDYQANLTSLEQIIYANNVTYDFLPIDLLEIEIALPWDEKSPIVSGSQIMRRLLNLTAFS
jgi:hypothetical protein